MLLGQHDLQLREEARAQRFNVTLARKPPPARYAPALKRHLKPYALPLGRPQQHRHNVLLSIAHAAAQQQMLFQRPQRELRRLPADLIQPQPLHEVSSADHAAVADAMRRVAVPQALWLRQPAQDRRAEPLRVDDDALLQALAQAQEDDLAD
jgi:hypothetical protein